MHYRDHVWEGGEWVLLEKCLLLCVFKTSSMSTLHLGYRKGDIIQRGCGEVGRRVRELTCYQRVHAAKGKVWFIICLFQLR